MPLKSTTTGCKWGTVLITVADICAQPSTRASLLFDALFSYVKLKR